MLEEAISLAVVARSKPHVYPSFQLQNGFLNVKSERRSLDQSENRQHSDSMSENASLTETIEVANRKVEVLSGGQGPDLVYLHSAAGEMEWSPFHSATGQRFRVHAPAHPGFSFSDGLEGIRDIDDMAWAVADNIEALKLGAVPVVGFSLGGWLACEVAIRRPDLISKIVLINSAGVRVDGHPMGDIWEDDFGKLRSLLFQDSTPDDIVEQAMPLSMEDARIIQWLKAREATARIGWNPYLHNPKLVKHLHRIKCPVLIIHGRDDKLLPLAGAELMDGQLASSELRVVDDAGHMLPWEQPDLIGKLVAEFCG